MKQLPFSKQQRLRTNHQFKAVISHRSRAADDLLEVFAAPNDLRFARLGVSLSRTIKPATARNRLKRLIKEAFRLNQHNIPPGFDYVVTYRRDWWSKINSYRPTTAARKLKLQQVADSFVKLATQATKQHRSNLPDEG